MLCMLGKQRGWYATVMATKFTHSCYHPVAYADNGSLFRQSPPRQSWPNHRSITPALSLSSPCSTR